MDPQERSERLNDESSVVNEIFNPDADREWTSKDGTVHVTYRKPKGLITLVIARVLGPAQAGNAVLEMFYRAAASIVHYKHFEDPEQPPIKDQDLPSPTSDIQFEFIFGYVFKGEDDMLNEFTSHWQMQFFPDLYAAMEELKRTGMSTPESVGRVTENYSKAQAKKLPRRSSRRNSSSS